MAPEVLGRDLGGVVSAFGAPRAFAPNPSGRELPCQAGDLADTWWSFDPWIWGSLALLAFLHPRSGWPFASALLALFVALIWPLDVLSDGSLAAHMAQHMLLIAVAAPMLVLSRPTLPLVAGLPARGRKAAGTALRWLARVVRPRPAFALHAAAIWLGHAPRVIEWAVAYKWVHVLEHAVLLGTAAAFWWALLRGRAAGAGEASLLTLATLIHTGLLGALLAFAPRTVYPGYTLEDQQLAGLIMWVPGGLCYLVAGLALAAAWMPRAE
jgi:cytochrome c oxidase assembly factor CtaG